MQLIYGNWRNYVSKAYISMYIYPTNIPMYKHQNMFKNPVLILSFLQLLEEVVMLFCSLISDILDCKVFGLRILFYYVSLQDNKTMTFLRLTEHS